MKFTRTKKLTFFSNKGGVGKTTLSYNLAVKFAKNGFKTVLIDLDPQANLSELALGNLFEKNLFSDSQNSISDVIKDLVSATGDVNFNVDLLDTNYENLQILPGSLKLSLFEEVLSANFTLAMSGQFSGYTITSAIKRFLEYKGLNEEIDLFMIDTSPSLGFLNKVILLDTDYFVTPLRPDNFSLMGIENIGKMLETWKDQWKFTAKALSREVPSNRVLSGEGLFIGYIVNSYNQYNKTPIKTHSKWIDRIKPSVKEYLSYKHCRNGLVESTYKDPLAIIKDYGQLPSQSQSSNKALFDFNKDDFPQGTVENIDKSFEELDELYFNVLRNLENY